MSPRRARVIRMTYAGHVSCGWICTTYTDPAQHLMIDRLGSTVDDVYVSARSVDR